MKYDEAIAGLVAHIKNTAGPKEAEWLLQDAITSLLRKRTGKEDFALFVNDLYMTLQKERKNCEAILEIIKLNSVIEIVEDYKTLI
jgi:hypothetical protein